MKTHAAEYGVNPERIVLGGGSAGGHLSMLASYAPTKPELTPPDVRHANLAVRAVVSEYGPSDLLACYFHTNQDKSTPALAPQAARDPGKASRQLELKNTALGKNLKRLGFDKAMDAGSFKMLLGGRPEEAPERYAMYSPVSYVHPGCPPTLLIQGEDDQITPVGATRQLYQKLVEAGVPAINVVFPQTDHAFDLALPEISPVVQSALYDIDRFLALMA
jgi:acetyl esterase/lipase